MPYEGTLIVVFYDRLLTSLTRSRVPSVLGYVLAHEIAHVLEGISRHSLSGIMKPAWSARDYLEMQWNTLRFTEDDVYLIRRGLEERAFQASKCDSTDEIAPQ